MSRRGSRARARRLPREARGLGDFAGVVVVSKDGATVFEKGYGLADRERKIANTPDLRFNIASIGKAFTTRGDRAARRRGQARAVRHDRRAAARLSQRGGEGRHDRSAPHPRGRHRRHLRSAVCQSRQAGQRSNADYFRMIAPEPLRFAPGAEQPVLQRLLHRARRDHRARVRHALRALHRGARVQARRDDGRRIPRLWRSEGRARLPPRRGRSRPPHSGDRRPARIRGGRILHARAADLLAFDTALRDGTLLTPKMTAWYLRLHRRAQGPRRRAGTRSPAARRAPTP